MPAGLAETINNLLSSARYRVEGDSMLPALSHGDQVLAARIRRAYRRGDVVVFQQPFQSHDVYIKRIIGLPQEEIVMDGGTVHINGGVLPEKYLPESRLTGEPMDVLVDHVGDQVKKTTRLWITDPGEYFVMGDQRDNSQDSRAFGPVQESLMLGRVWLRYWPLGAWGMMDIIPGGGQT